MQEVFPPMAWMTFFAFLVVASLLFAVANKQSVAQSATLMTRLFLQLGYQLTLRRREEIIQWNIVTNLPSYSSSGRMEYPWRESYHLLLEKSLRKMFGIFYLPPITINNHTTSLPFISFFVTPNMPKSQFWEHKIQVKYIWRVIM